MRKRREMARWAQEILAMLATGSTIAGGAAALPGCVRDDVDEREDAGAGGSGGGGPVAGGVGTPVGGGGGEVVGGGGTPVGGGGGEIPVGGGLLPSMACRNPMPYIRGEFDTGFVVCEGGWRHRARVVECAPFAPQDDEECPAEEGFESECKVDADCAARPHGFCRAGSIDFGEPACGCFYGCVTDADCTEGNICECGAAGGSCKRSKCESDAECGGGLCATVEYEPYCGGEGFACQTSVDECMVEADCEAGPCAYDHGKRFCEEGGGCAIGRPFLVDGLARVACVVDGAAWSGALASMPLLPACEAERAGLAEFFTRSAQLEHASIAAFARFTLELLAFGAPPDLLRDAQRAMADETEHARMCFTLASLYSGRALDPGRLSLTGAVVATTLADCVEAAIREGCVGETVAALEAAEASAAAEDDVLRDVFARIAVDERRHAELAWRFVRWAIAQGDAVVVERARNVFAEVGVEAGAGASAVGRAAQRVVIGPAAEALLAA